MEEVEVDWIRESLGKVASLALPRILTQVCRDPTSPNYGCCDRNWWHYKIRDFPSIILQQAGYALAEAASTPVGTRLSSELLGLATATGRFWNQRAMRMRAFEEYYPYEQGYPPLAFSALSVAKLCSTGLVEPDTVYPGMKVASRQLLNRWEGGASNQQIAGISALSVVRNIWPQLVPSEAFNHILDRTLRMQTEEGWFPEYGGPDLGYLSVSIDCLWDLYNYTLDGRILVSIEKALLFLSWFVLGPTHQGGMHNSRNTDYILPYGWVRYSIEVTKPLAPIVEALNTLYDPEAKERVGFFYAIDDRYWAHYVGHSVLRALNRLEHALSREQTNPSIAIPGSRTTTLSPSNTKRLSGHAILSSEGSNPSALVATKKGCLFSAVWSDGSYVTDFGWILAGEDGSYYTSHWWSDRWEVSINDNTITCSGSMVSHAEHQSSPGKHALLRLLSFLLGSRLIRLLKRVMIFKPHRSRYGFERTVFLSSNSVEVTDIVTGKLDGIVVSRAPRSSKRHVASADSFHIEDFCAIRGVKMVSDTQRDNRHLRVTTRYYQDHLQR